MEVPSVIRERMRWLKDEIERLRPMLGAFLEEMDALEVASAAIVEAAERYEADRLLQPASESREPKGTEPENDGEDEQAWAPTITDKILSVATSPLTTNEIAALTGLSPRQVAPRLTMMCQRGRIQHSGTKWWVDDDAQQPLP